MKARRNSRSRCKLLFMLLACSASAATGAAESTPEVVTVRAQLPGPAPWKVGKADHVLWIFAYPGVVPETLEWNSARLERALERSQEFIALPTLDLGFRIPRRQFELPEGTHLVDVLPTAVYDDYLALKGEIFPDADMERFEELHPFVAGTSLLRGLYARSGLVEGAQIVRRMDRLARERRGLRHTQIQVEPTRAERRELRALYSETFGGVTMEQGVACFSGAIAHLKDDLALLQERAKAWAEGNVSEVGGLRLSREDNDYCATGLADIREREVMGRLAGAMLRDWHTAVDAALLRNESTVAIRDIRDLLDEDGILQELQRRGYTVEAPAQ